MSSSSSPAPTPNAMCSRSELVPWPAASMRSRCSVERPTNSTRGAPAHGPHRAVEAGRRPAAAPSARPAGRLGGRRDQRVERRRRGRSSPASTCSSSHRRRSRSWWRAADRARDRLGEEAERPARAGRAKRARRDDLGPEDDDDVRARSARSSATQRAGVGVLAELEEARAICRRDAVAERAGLEERGLPDEREPQRPPGGRRGVRKAAGGDDDAHAARVR